MAYAFSVHLISGLQKAESPTLLFYPSINVINWCCSSVINWCCSSVNPAGETAIKSNMLYIIKVLGAMPVMMKT